MDEQRSISQLSIADSSSVTTSENALKRELKNKQKEEERKLKAEEKAKQAAAKPSAKAANDEDLDPTQYFENRPNVLAAEKSVKNPYPHEFKASLTIPEYIAEYKGLADGDRKEEVEVSVTGQIMNKRSSSTKLFFYDLHGRNAKIQVIAEFSSSKLDESQFLELHSGVKRGDIVGLVGYPGKSKRGELSIFPQSVVVLSHCLPLMPKEKTATGSEDMKITLKRDERHTDDLMIDVLIDIFRRLPVKTIGQCLCVCKLWQLVIQHPSFVKAKFQHHSPDLVLVRSFARTSGGADESQCYTLHCDDEKFSVYANYQFPTPICDYAAYPVSDYSWVIGSCNGVICVTDRKFCRTTFLWNPTIQKCIELPPATLETKYADYFLGFGFDKENDDYKVVRIVSAEDLGLQIEIYSLSSGLWRNASNLAVNLGVEVRSSAAYSVYLNGSVYWFLDEQHQKVVISFDLTKEEFSRLEPPPSEGEYYSNELVVFQESLAVLATSSREKCCVWIMKDNGDSTSWAKHVDFNLSGDVERVFGLRSNSELLIQGYGGRLFSLSLDYEAAKGKRPCILSPRERLIWNYIQKYPRHDKAGSQTVTPYTVSSGTSQHIVSQRVLDYNPKSEPKRLGIKSNAPPNMSFGFQCAGYRESLVLFGRNDCCQVKCKTNEEVNSDVVAHSGGRTAKSG